MIANTLLQQVVWRSDDGLSTRRRKNAAIVVVQLVNNRPCRCAGKIGVISANPKPHDGNAGLWKDAAPTTIGA
jgi:hypothetical protein